MYQAIAQHHGKGRFRALRGLDMRGLVWIALGALLGLAASTAAWALTARFGLDDSAAASTIFAAVVALLTFYVASFCVPACIAALQIAATNRRLVPMLRAAAQVPIEPDRLYDSFVGSWFPDLGDCYVQTLRASGVGERWRGRDPAEAFPARSVIEDPLMMGFFCRFPAFFIALALIALLMGTADIIDGGLTSVTALSELRATLVSSAAAFGAAGFSLLAQPLLLALCQTQLRRFVLQLRLLYAVDDGSFELRQLVEAMAGLRRELVGGAQSEDALAELRSDAAPRSRLKV
jgi:hypothetical protein